jgi:hypothetical protein
MVQVSRFFIPEITSQGPQDVKHKKLQLFNAVKIEFHSPFLENQNDGQIIWS